MPRVRRLFPFGARWRPLVLFRFYVVFTLMVRLHLQQRYDTVADIVILVHAGAVLLVTAVEKLAAVFLEAGLENNEITASINPDRRRAFDGFPVTGAEAYIRIGELQLNAMILAPALLEGFGEGPDFGFGKVRYAWHGNFR